MPKKINASVNDWKKWRKGKDLDKKNVDSWREGNKEVRIQKVKGKQLYEVSLYKAKTYEPLFYLQSPKIIWVMDTYDVFSKKKDALNYAKELMKK